MGGSGSGCKSVAWQWQGGSWGKICGNGSGRVAVVEKKCGMAVDGWQWGGESVAWQWQGGSGENSVAKAVVKWQWWNKCGMAVAG
jgi:hypothetical protein